ncbi:hypothetical protein ACRALDRAFT_2027658 [Sodiomyces alcalophilus JCM 7366]|uniref:uncharacterized protein n=1 Tax=Sodiomyces alcalophilus JCM 7366 TaxID=591952 RepID=UPI0039B51C07
MASRQFLCLHSCRTTRWLRNQNAVATRPFHWSPAVQFPYKDSQDRNSIMTSKTEGTKSGRDSDASEDTEAAYNPKKTSPEAAKEAAEGPELDVSGANQEISKPMGDKGEAGQGAGKEVRKGGSSGGKSPAKEGKPPV